MLFERATMKTFYDILGVRPDADADAVRTAFRKAVKAHHPDLHAGDPEAGERFKQIVAASAVLRDGEQRAAYDRLLELEREHLRSERRRTVIGCAIVAAVVSAGIVGASALFAPAPTPATVAGKANRDAATRDKHEVVEAFNLTLEPSAAAPPANNGGEEALVGDELPVGLVPNAAKFYRERGIAAYRRRDLDRAIAAFDQAIQLDPKDAQAYDNRGNAWDDKGERDRALADYDQAIRIDPNNPALFHDRGILWQRKGALDSALIDMDRAIRFSFADAKIYSDRGLVWYEKGRYDRAIADLNRAISLDPSFASAYINRGIILHRKGEFDRAYADIDQAIRINPNVLDAIRRAVLSPEGEH
jgi:tetratricopeptide (TPR) repeat protein